MKNNNLLISITAGQLRVLIDALNTNGVNNQIEIAIEEMSELIKALCKVRRSDASPEEIDSARNNVIEEIADVQIVIVQMLLLFDLREDVQKILDYKIERLDKRLHPEEHSVEIRKEKNNHDD